MLFHALSSLQYVFRAFDVIIPKNPLKQQEEKLIFSLYEEFCIINSLLDVYIILKDY